MTNIRSPDTISNKKITTHELLQDLSAQFLNTQLPDLPAGLQLELLQTQIEFRKAYTGHTNIEADVNTLMPFREFLVNRYTKRLYNNHPLHTSRAPWLGINRACIKLGEILSSFYGTTVHELLSPRLKRRVNNITGTTLDEPILKPSHYVLSDSEESYIELLPTLDCAREDGILRHCFTENLRAKRLSKSEAARVKHHSPATKQYSDTIEKIVAIKYDGNSIGSQIQHLIVALRKGSKTALSSGILPLGESGGGKEYDAGANANEGILRFAHFLTLLPQEVYAELMQLSDHGHPEMTFGEIWGRLARPSDQDYKEVVYCVNIIADKLEAFLHCNTQLYNSQIDFAQELAVARAQLEAALNADNYQTCIDQEAEEIPSWLGRLNDDEIADLAKDLTTHAQLILLLSAIPMEKRALACLQLDKVQHKILIQSHQALIEILKLLPMNAVAPFIAKITREHLRNILFTSDNTPKAIDLSFKQWLQTSEQYKNTSFYAGLGLATVRAYYDLRCNDPRGDTFVHPIFSFFFKTVINKFYHVQEKNEKLRTALNLEKKWSNQAFIEPDESTVAQGRLGQIHSRWRR